MASISFSLSGEAAAAAAGATPTWHASAVASSGSSSSPPPAASAAIEPTASKDDKEAEERRLLRKKMVQVQDVALDTKLEVMKLKFSQRELLRRRYMERWWMEIRIRWERASIAGRSSPSAPYFNGCPPILRGDLRVKDVVMTANFINVMAVEHVNLPLLSALHEIGPDGAAGLGSEQLKRKWALEEEQLISSEAKKANPMTAVAKEHFIEERVPLQGKNSELLDDEEENQDGKLSDVKRLDKEILSMTLEKVEWRRSYKESYEWYYPLAELSSREEHLTKLAERLAKRAEARGTALPTECEVIGCMLLDLLATTAMSPSISAGFFPAP